MTGARFTHQAHALWKEAQATNSDVGLLAASALRLADDGALSASSSSLRDLEKPLWSAPGEYEYRFTLQPSPPMRAAADEPPAAMHVTFRVQTTYGKQECVAKPARQPPNYTYSPARQPRASRASPTAASPGAASPAQSPTRARADEVARQQLVDGRQRASSQLARLDAITAEQLVIARSGASGARGASGGSCGGECGAGGLQSSQSQPMLWSQPQQSQPPQPPQMQQMQQQQMLMQQQMMMQQQWQQQQQQQRQQWQQWQQQQQQWQQYHDANPSKAASVNPSTPPIPFQGFANAEAPTGNLAAVQKPAQKPPGLVRVRTEGNLVQRRNKERIARAKGQ